MNNQMLYLEQVDSTLSYCKENFDKMADGSVVFTSNQTAGRGRLGRVWVNTPSDALYYSVVLKRELLCPSALPLAVCIAIEDALERMYGISGQIKWPNDILVCGKKLVGVLCEAHSGGYIIGAGINLLQNAEFFKSNALPNATSIFIETQKKPQDFEALALALTKSILAVMDCFATEGFAPLRGEYRARCVNLLRAVRCGEISGIATNINLDGSLCVKTDTGELISLTGEVSVQGIYGEV